MPDAIQPEIAVAARLRADLIGAVCGCMVLPLHGVLRHLPLGQMYSLTAMGGLLIMALLAGFVTVLTQPAHLQSPSRAIGIGIQLGLRAGARAVVVGGALLTLLAALNVLAAFNAEAELQLKSRLWLTWLVAIAAVLPGVFVGLVGGALGARLVANRIATAVVAASTPADALWLRREFYGVVLLALAGLGCPLIVLNRAPIIDASPMAGSLPLPFHYETPAALKTARLGQIQPAFTKTIDGVAEDAAMSLSPDGRLLAFCTNQSPPAITVFDLERFQPLCSFPVPAFPRSNLCWSPAMKRLACTLPSREKESRLWILDLPGKQAIELPRPRHRDTPDGELSWWTEKEVAFFPADEAPLVLDLVKLTLQPAADAAFLQAADAATRQRLLKGPAVTIPASQEWRLDVTTVLSSMVPPPRRQPEAPWHLRGGSLCALAHPTQPVAHGFPALPVREGMRLFCAPDGSKLIRIEDDRAEVTYMQVAEASACQFEVVMPVSVAEMHDAALQQQISTRELCALVYAPLVNPLNHQTVGPDHARVKALVRLLEWQGRRAVFATVTLVEAVTATDVISTLHTWQNGSLTPRPATGPDWWAAVNVLAESSLAAVPAGAVLSALETPLPLTLTPTAAALVVTQAEPRAVVPAAAPAPLFPMPASPTALIIPGAAHELNDADVRAFVREHHRKASLGDVDGMTLDYHDRVDFLDKGQLTQDAIHAQEAQQRLHWPTSSEAIVGDIALEHAGAAWTAAYTIEFANATHAGESQRGQADLTLTVIATAGGLRITSQKASVHDVQSGAARK